MLTVTSSMSIWTSDGYPTENGVMRSRALGESLGCPGQPLQERIRQLEEENGKVPGMFERRTLTHFSARSAVISVNLARSDAPLLGHKEVSLRGEQGTFRLPHQWTVGVLAK